MSALETVLPPKLQIVPVAEIKGFDPLEVSIKEKLTYYLGENDWDMVDLLLSLLEQRRDQRRRHQLALVE